MRRKDNTVYIVGLDMYGISTATHYVCGCAVQGLLYGLKVQRPQDIFYFSCVQ